MESLCESKMAVIRLLFLLRAQKSLDSCDSTQSIAKEREIQALICQYHANITKLWQKLGKNEKSVTFEGESCDMSIEKTVKAPRIFDFFRMERPARFSRVSVLGRVARVVSNGFYSVVIDLARRRVSEFSLCASNEHVNRAFLKRLAAKLNGCLKMEQAFLQLDRVLFNAFLVVKFLELVAEVYRVADEFGCALVFKRKCLVMDFGSMHAPVNLFELVMERSHIELRSKDTVFVGDKRVLYMERMECRPKADVLALMSTIRNMAVESAMRIKYVNWTRLCPDAEIEYSGKRECPLVSHIDFLVEKHFVCSLEKIPVEKKRLFGILCELAWTGKIEHNGVMTVLNTWSLPGVQIALDSEDTRTAVIIVNGKVDRFRTIHYPATKDPILRIREGLRDLFRTCLIAEVKNTIVNTNQKVVTMIQNCRLCLSFPFLDTVFLDFSNDLSWTLRVPSYGSTSNGLVSIMLRGRAVVTNFLVTLVEFLRRLAVYVKMFSVKPKNTRHSILIEYSSVGELDALFKAVSDDNKEYTLGSYSVHGAQRVRDDLFYICSPINALPEIEISFTRSAVLSKLLTEILLIPNEHDFRFFAFFVQSCPSLFRICYHFSGGMWNVISGPRHFQCYVIFQRKLTLHIHLNGSERFTCATPVSQDSISRIIQMAFAGVPTIRRRDLENVPMIVYEDMKLDGLFEMKKHCEFISRNVWKLAKFHAGSILETEDQNSLCVECPLQNLRIVAEISVNGVELTVKEQTDQLAELLTEYLRQNLDPVKRHSACIDFVFGLNSVPYPESCNTLRKVLGKYEENQKMSVSDRMDVFDDLFSV